MVKGIIKTRTIALMGLALSISALILVSVLISTCGREPPRLLRVAVNPWPGYEPLYLAKAEGFLHEVNTEFVEFPSLSGSTRALLNGAVEAAALTLEEVLKLRERGLEIKVVLVFDISDGGDVLMARPDLCSIADLKGAKILTEGTTLSRYLLLRALENHNMSLKDVTLVHQPVSEHLSLFEHGEVDAVVTYEPALTQLQNRGAQVLFSSRDIPGEIVDVLAVREDYLVRHPDQVRGLIDGWYEALWRLEQQPFESAEVLARRLHISPQEVLESLKGIKLPPRSQTQQMLGSGPDSMVAATRRLAELMHERDLIHEDIHIPRLFTSEYID